MMSKNYFVVTVPKDRVHYQELQGSKLKKILMSPLTNCRNIVARCKFLVASLCDI